MIGRTCVFLAALMLAGCDTSVSSSQGSAQRPRVVATTTMIGDLVKRIAGDRVELKVIMPAGVDPHTFKPSTADLGDIQRATLVLFNGLHLEGKMVELLEHEMKDRAVAVTHGVPENLLLSWKDSAGGAHDPHIWFDVSIWSLAA